MLRYFLPVYLLVYFGTAFFLPTFRVWRRTKINPLVLGNSDDARDYIGRVFKIVMAMIAVVVLIYSLVPQLYGFLMPIRILERAETQIVGIALLLLSLGWTILAQIQMGNSWRIGIDQKERTNLVRSGVFGVSRNPIFLGMLITLFGLFPVLPNAFTLLIFVLGFVLIQIQVRLEEEFLMNMHEVDYKKYCHDVRRWL
jgi:protein-S-isoprenylcysteine O-methyltransferase Ste14